MIETDNERELGKSVVEAWYDDDDDDDDDFLHNNTDLFTHSLKYSYLI